MIKDAAQQTYALHQLADIMENSEIVIQREGKTRLKISCGDTQLAKNLTKITPSTLRMLAAKIWDSIDLS